MQETQTLNNLSSVRKIGHKSTRFDLEWESKLDLRKGGWTSTLFTIYIIFPFFLYLAEEEDVFLFFHLACIAYSPCSMELYDFRVKK